MRYLVLQFFTDVRGGFQFRKCYRMLFVRISEITFLQPRKNCTANENLFIDSIIDGWSIQFIIMVAIGKRELWTKNIT